jgi:hypothetical protein
MGFAPALQKVKAPTSSRAQFAMDLRFNLLSENITLIYLNVHAD